MNYNLAYRLNKVMANNITAVNLCVAAQAKCLRCKK